ncbi:putative reverse transcriptase domain-containing protein [Tanacetum coccineum]
MPTSGQGLSVATIEQLITQRVAEAMAAYETNQNNQNGNPNVNVGGVVPFSHTYKADEPLNYKGIEGVVVLTRWFEKMRRGFTSSIILRRTIGTDATYAMTWKALIKLMTEVYCPRNEIQKMETELSNLSVKGNDLTAYTQRFQELILLCTKMVPEEEDRVEKFIGGLPNNI